MYDNKIKSLKELIYGAGFAFIFGFIGYILMFLFKLIAARYYGPENFGLFSLAETIIKITILVAAMGIHNGIVRYLPYYKTLGNKKLLKGYMKFVFLFTSITSVIFFLFIFTFSDAISNFFNFPELFSSILKIISLVIPFQLFNKVFQKIMLANKRIIFNKISVELIEKATLLLGVIFLWIFKLSLIYLIYIYLGSLVLAFIFNFYIYQTKFKINLTGKTISHYKEWIFFSLPLVFGALFGFFINWTDNLVIGKIMDPTALGIYSIVFSFSSFLLFTQGAFVLIFMPLISENFAKKDHKMISFLFKKSSSWVFGITAPVFFIIVFYSKEILNLLYGPAYIIGSIPLIILSLGSIFNVISGLNLNILTLHRKTGFIFSTNVIIATLNIILNIIFISKWGLIGAATSTAISISLQQLIFHYLASKYETLRFDWVYLAKFTLAGLPAIFIGKFVFHLFSNVLISAFISLFFYLILYLIFLLLFKTFKKEDFMILSEIERKIGLDLKFIKKIVMKFY